MVPTRRASERTAGKCSLAAPLDGFDRRAATRDHLSRKLGFDADPPLGEDPRFFFRVAMRARHRQRWEEHRLTR